MKNIIHVDIQNEEGKNECYERTGGFLIAVMTLFAIWRYGKGRIIIGDDDEEPLVS